MSPKGVLLALAVVAGCACPQSALALEELTPFSHALVCKDLRQALSLHDAFTKSTEKGWRRYAIEAGRGRRYSSQEYALERNVCIHVDLVVGKMLSTIKLKNGNVHHLERIVRYIHEDGIKRDVRNGRVFVLDIRAGEAPFVTGYLVELELRKLLSPVLPRP